MPSSALAAKTCPGFWQESHAPTGHASIRTYVVVAVILTLVTAMEFSAIYIRELTPIHRSLEEFFMEVTNTDPETGRAKA